MDTLNDSEEQGYDYRVGASDLTSTSWSPWTSIVLRVIDDPVSEPVMTSHGVDEETLQDLQDYAADEGRSLQSVVDLYKWQPEFNEDVEALMAAYPNGFSQAEMNPDGTPGALVEFKGTVPAGADEIVSDLPIQVEVIGGAPYSATETEALTIAGHEGVVQQAPTGSVVETGFDVDSDSLKAVVYAPSPAPSKDAYAAAARTEIASELPTIEVPGVEVEIVSEPPAEMEALRGGAKIGYYNDDDCTTGFPVKAAGQIAGGGLLTARHCENDMHWYGAGNRQQRFVFDDASKFLEKSRGDIQYHPKLSTVDERVSTHFYWKPKRHRELRGWSYPQKGNLACLYGKTTRGTYDGRRTCAYIHGLRYSATYKKDDGGEWTFHGLVKTKRRVSRDGDSGGPWFLRRRALGINSGGGHNLFWDWSFFTPIQTIQTMGLVLHTGCPDSAGGASAKPTC